MRADDLGGVSRRRGHKTTVRGRDQPGIPDLVDRNYKAAKPDQLWVADITYVPTWSGFVFLAVVLDAYSRRIVGALLAEQNDEWVEARRYVTIGSPSQLDAAQDGNDEVAALPNATPELEDAA